jgi:hypothetical protein
LQAKIVKLLIDTGHSDALWLFANKNDDINIPSKILRITLGDLVGYLWQER